MCLSFTKRKCPRNVGTSLARQSIVFEKSNYESAFVSPSPPLCCWRLVFTKPASAVRCCFCRTGVLTLRARIKRCCVKFMTHNDTHIITSIAIQSALTLLTLLLVQVQIRWTWTGTGGMMIKSHPNNCNYNKHILDIQESLLRLSTNY